MEQKRQYKISFAMLRSRTSFLRVVYPCPYRRCNALKSSEKRTLSHNIPYWIESASGLSDCALLVAQQQRRKQSSRTLAQSLSLTTVFGFTICYLSKRRLPKTMRLRLILRGSPKLPLLKCIFLHVKFLIPLRKFSKTSPQIGTRLKSKITLQSRCIRISNRHITRLHRYQFLMTVKIIIFRKNSRTN